MQKAISEIIVVVMLLMISVAIVGVAYVFIMGFQEQAKTEVQQSGTEAFKRVGSCLQTVSFDDKTNNLYVKNCGRYLIENVTVFIDKKPVSSVPINAKPNEIKGIPIASTAGIHEVKLVSDYATAAISINVKNAAILFFDMFFDIENNAGQNAARFSSSGGIILRGTCTASATCIPPADAPFIIKNLLGGAVSFVDNSGNLCIQDANCNDKDSNCDSPGDGPFIIRNSTDKNVAYINSAGSLCLIGPLVQNGNP